MTRFPACFSLSRNDAEIQGMAGDDTVGDVAAEFLPACPATIAFGMARGEPGGGHMADGYAPAPGR